MGGAGGGKEGAGQGEVLVPVTSDTSRIRGCSSPKRGQSAWWAGRLCKLHSEAVASPGNLAFSFFIFCSSNKHQDSLDAPCPQPSVLSSLTLALPRSPAPSQLSDCLVPELGFLASITQITSGPILGGLPCGPCPARPPEGRGDTATGPAKLPPFLVPSSPHGLWLLPSSDKGRHGDLSGYEVDLHI